MCQVRLTKAEGDGCGNRRRQYRKQLGISSEVCSQKNHFCINDSASCKRIRYRCAHIVITLLFVTALLTISPRSFAQTYDVYIEQTPPNGGTVAPGTGAFEYNHQQLLRLRANPKPGYRFARWEGLSGDPDRQTENETDAVIDSPMIIVAVFVREGSPTGLGTALHPSRLPMAAGGSAPTFPDPVDRPKPTPVPEPTSIALLGIGSLLILRKRKKN